MAGIFRDGFDGYTGTTAPVGLAVKWALNGTPTLVTGRFGGQALRVNAVSGFQLLSGTFDSAVSSMTLNLGFRITNFIAAAGRKQLELNSGATTNVGLSFEADGSIGIYRLTTLLGTIAAGTVALNTWYSMQIELVVNDTTGRVTVYIDDKTTPKINLTSVDTNNAVTTVNTLRIGYNGSGGGVIEVDDVYVTNSATSPTDFLRIETLAVSSDGGTLNFTPSTGSSHFAVVDELPASSTDYLSGSTVGHLDILGLANLSTTPVSIEEVNVVGFLQKTDATARSMALGVISGATTSDGSNYTLNSSGLRHDRPLATDPDTSAAWTASGVNALNLQPKVTV